MEKMSHKQKNWFVAISIIIVLLLSSIVGAILLDKERTTGGMETKWKLEIKNSDEIACQINDTIIVHDDASKQLESIDSNGSTIQNFPCASLISVENHNSYCSYTDQNNGTTTISCIGTNGLKESSFTHPGVCGVYRSDDGNYFYYLHSQDNSTMDTMKCVRGDGSEKWSFTYGTNLSLCGVCDDGTVIVGHDFSQCLNVTSQTWEPVVKEWFSISLNGTVLGIMNQPLSTTYVYDGEAGNGTIEAHYYDWTDCSCKNVGLTEDLQNNWTLEASNTTGAYQANGTSGWNVAGAYENGLLLYDDIGVKLIDDHASTQWQYDLDSWTISSVHIGTDGTIFVVSNDGVVAIHKPTMSMTMTYLMVLVGFDVLVVLTGSIWLLDRRSKEKRNGP